MPESAIKLSSDTIIFGEKLTGSGHYYMDFLELDPARLFAVVSKHPGRFSDQVFQNGFREKLEAQHPLLADRLPDVARFKRQQSALVTTRRLIKDPDLRFFVALLLNAGSRPQIS